MSTKTIPVVEIFGPTLQGEGPNVGARCIFLRTKFCDYQCSFCDSKFTWTNHESDTTNYGREQLTERLIYLCESNNCKRVILTGGNPCLYDFEDIIVSLNCKGIDVDIETQGSILPDWMKYLDTIVFSPKGPTSGMPDTYNKITEYISNNRNNLPNIAIKIPVFNQEDIDFARKYSKFVNEFNKDNDTQIKMYLSVGNSDVDTTESIRDRVLSDYESLLNKINENPEDFEKVYLLPQIHTLVWGNKSGV